MFKKLQTFIICSIFTTLSINAYQSDFINYERLTNMAGKTGYTDHIPHWRCLFNTMKVRGFLECGCGYSTAYFLDHSEKVISVEYINPGYGPDWFYTAKSLFEDRPNWIPLLYNESLKDQSFNNACAYQCSIHQDYAVIDPSYLISLNQHFKSLIAQAAAGNYPIDVAFVDPGVYIRGDMVKLLLSNRIPVVAAHDTASDYGTDEAENLYGWNKVFTPPQYTKIHIPYGQGTTFWVLNKLPQVIASLEDYRDRIKAALENGQVTPAMLTEFADMPLTMLNE